MPSTRAKVRKRTIYIRRHFEMLLIGSVLFALNLHLVGLGSARPLVLIPQAVVAGQWWRVFTHPFVHVSFYHLALDAGAFLLLYRAIDHRSASARAACSLTCAAFGAAAAWLSAAPIDTLGLCGLSAAAHGLMALTALQQIEKADTVRLGAASFLLVASKSVAEAITGEVMFGFLHMGLCGSPLAACHLGGVCGGVIAFITGKLPAELKAWALQASGSRVNS